MKLPAVTATGAAVSVAASVVALGFAAPASAELTDGTYSVTWEGDADSTNWIVTPCGDGCKRIEVPATGRVTDFHLDGNMWTSQVAAHSVMTIDDGSLDGALCTGTDICSRYRMVKVR